MDFMASVAAEVAECLVQPVRYLAGVVPCDVESNQFGFKLCHQPVRRSREDPCSCVLPDSIIHDREVNDWKIVILLLDADVELHVYFVSILGMGGLGKTAFASDICQSQVSETPSHWIKQQSECKENHLLLNSPPISGHRKAGHLWGDSWEDDKEQDDWIRATPTTGEEAERSDYDSSFTSFQLSTLAISSFLLCLLALFPKLDKQNEAIPAVALIVAALASRISLQTISKRPGLARCCGSLAFLSLIVALASFTFIRFLRLVNRPCLAAPVW